MLLTNCGACAASLAHDAPRCVRCETRYCSATCQLDHWRRGHKQICKKIHRGGNAEQYYANKKYKEAVAEAVEACADDTKGQKCFICLEAVHPRTGEGLVRGCACGDRDGVAFPELGFAHVSCLARQAQIFFAEIEENYSDDTELDARWTLWRTCGLCDQEFHGIVRCALGWACWKTYVGRPEEDWDRIDAMTELGNSLHDAKHHEDELSVREAELSMRRRLGADEYELLVAQGNLACTYRSLGRLADALRLRRDIYSGCVRLDGEEDPATLVEANNYANGLVDLQRFEEAKSLLRKTIPIARRVLGDGHELTLMMRSIYSDAEGKRDQRQDEPGTSSYDYKCYAEAVRIQKRRGGGGAT